MKPIPQYSIVIFPDPEQSELIKSYKQQLKNKIGWFGSANAAAHVTVIQFDNEMSLGLYLTQIREFCKTVAPQEVVFNSLDAFEPHTFFIAPDAASQQYLDKLILDLHQYLGIKTGNVHTHISIARRLTSEKINIAYELFSNVSINFRFIADAFYIRKFNEQTKQYADIVEQISFGDKG